MSKETAPQEMHGLSQESINTLRKNVTIKEGLGIAFDLGLERLEERAKLIWPDMHSVLVSNNDIGGVNQVAEYEGFGYVLGEDGKKSQHTVPNKDMARMLIPQALYDEYEKERVREQNSRVNMASSQAKPGEAFGGQLPAQNLQSFLEQADANYEKHQADAVSMKDLADFVK